MGHKMTTLASSGFIRFPLEKYLFKVLNKNTRETTKDAIIVPLLLVVNNFYPVEFLPALSLKISKKNLGSKVFKLFVKPRARRKCVKNKRLNPIRTNPTNWSNTLRQFVGWGRRIV